MKHNTKQWVTIKVMFLYLIAQKPHVTGCCCLCPIGSINQHWGRGHQPHWCPVANTTQVAHQHRSILVIVCWNHLLWKGEGKLVQNGTQDVVYLSVL